MYSLPSFLTLTPDVEVGEVTYRPSLSQPRVLAVLGFGSSLSLSIEDARKLSAGLVAALAEYDRASVVSLVKVVA